MNRLWLTQIYLYRFYIPELIRLANDVETNPGPGIVDPTKTIAAPYSQGNIEIFGATNAGTQCVAMSLSALVYSFRNPITSSADLVQIMNIGNNMYSALSQSCKQGLLLLTDLPVRINLGDINYQLIYSESYSGLLNSAPPIIPDFPYVTSLLTAFNSLLMNNYHAFILTVDIYTVAIYCLPNERYKVFDSHSRDLLGMGNPFGTCTLIEIDSLMNLVPHFQNIYRQTSYTYEIKGVIIIEMQSNSVSLVHSLQVQTQNFRPNEHLNDVLSLFLQRMFSCVILFYLFFHLKIL